MCLVEGAALAVEAGGAAAVVAALGYIFLVELAVAAEAALQAVREVASASAVTALVGQALSKLPRLKTALLVEALGSVVSLALALERVLAVNWGQETGLVLSQLLNSGSALSKELDLEPV
jgi:hypothetical protein